MDVNGTDGQAATMEVDGETLAMDTNDEDIGEEHVWSGDAVSDMNSEHKMADLPTVSEPFSMVCQKMPGEIPTQVLCLPEGVCQKRVLQKGEGLYGPVFGSCCTITLQVMQSMCNIDASEVGYSVGQSSLQVGEGGTPISCLIDAALMSMKRGESAEACISRMKNPENEFIFHITLHHFTSVTPLWRLTPPEKCSSAMAHKEKGAQLFKKGSIYAAFAHFRVAVRLLLSILPYSFIEDKAAEESHQQLLCQCYLNLAACQMKSGHHNHVVTNCTEALNVDPSSIKALYRRASANISLGNLLKAHEDLEMGLRKEPNNQALLGLIQTLNSKLAQSESQMAQGLSKMFS